MALVNKTFSVNVTPGAMPPIVHVSEYDVGRAYTVSILDEQGNTFTIPSGTTASIEGTLNGSVGFTQSATVSNNTVSFTLSESMTAYSGKAWCKIKLTQSSQPIQTCAFILAVDRAGVESDTVIGAPGFQEQINQGVAEYFDNDPPFFELPSGGQSGQALLSDGNDGAVWGQAQSGGSGLTEGAKQALLDCFENVAWINGQGQTYYDALYAALYPPVDVLSISAVFTQGSAVIYDTDSLDTLRQYLVVTATMSDSTTQTVTDYTLSGTLAAGTSVITVSYGGKTTTFNVTVTHESLLPDTYQQVEWIESSGGQKIDTGVSAGENRSELPKYQLEAEVAIPVANTSTAIIMSKGQQPGCWFGNYNSGADVGMGGTATLTGIDVTAKNNYKLFWTGSGTSMMGNVQCGEQSVSKTVANQIDYNSPFTFFSDSYNTDFPAKCRIYRAKVKKNDSYIRDLVPCYQKSDSVIGMYDIVNDTFYTNSGTGTFTKGSDV